MLNPSSLIALPLALAVASLQLRENASGSSQTRATITAPSALSAASDLNAGRIVPQPRITRYAVAATGNEARYRIREQLAGMDLPNDAVGKTSQVTGAIHVSSDGRVIRDGSSFTVDLASIQSDNQRRDNYVRRNTLQTDSFPKAVFVPIGARGLPATLPAAGQVTFQLIGDLTIHGITRQATWQVKAVRTPSGGVTGTATTNFKFGDYRMTMPKVARVLSVDDSITLEYDFTLEPQPATK